MNVKISHNNRIDKVIEYTAKEPPNVETKKKLELKVEKVSILQNEYLIN